MELRLRTRYRLAQTLFAEKRLATDANTGCPGGTYNFRRGVRLVRAAMLVELLIADRN